MPGDVPDSSCLREGDTRRTHQRHRLQSAARHTCSDAKANEGPGSEAQTAMGAHFLGASQNRNAH